MDTYNKNINIIVIGAGASGLASASQLKKKGFNKIEILEASSILGGRVRKYPKENNFCDFDIELGGEEVHGEESEYYQMVMRNSAKLFSYWSDNKFYINHNEELKPVEELLQRPENSHLKFCWDLFEDVSYEFIQNYPDVTLREYLQKNNISEDVYFLANAMLGVEAGTDLDKLSLKGFQDLCKEWRSGVSNFLITNMSHVDVITREFSNVLENIRYNTAIVKVDYSNKQKIILQDRSDNLYECDVCIITIPINCLKKLFFVPSLPGNFNTAIDELKMDSVAKIILKFKERIWPSDASLVLIPGLINVYWPTGQGKNSSCKMLTGLVSGESCRILNGLYKEDKEKFLERVLNELNEGLKLNSREIYEKFDDVLWFNWTEMEFIGGGYTYSAVNEGNIRNTLRGNVDERLFFAGEATAENGHFGTIHGAIESGFRVADGINKLFN